MEGVKAFFDRIETGKGWADVRQFVAPGATFSAQQDALKQLRTVEEYCHWAQEANRPLPGCGYELHFEGSDAARGAAAFLATFRGTNSAASRGRPPTGRSTASHYLYCLNVDKEGKIAGMTKVWHGLWSARQLGYAKGRAAPPPAPTPPPAPGAAAMPAAAAFFDACEHGQGWAACRQYCADGATFDSQCEPLAQTKSVEAYCTFMEDTAAAMPGCDYDLHFAGVDAARGTACFFATFNGTHKDTGGSCATHYAYNLHFNAAGKINHMVKVWNSPWSTMQLKSSAAKAKSKKSKM